MKKTKKIVGIMLDLIEFYIPSVIFFLLLVSFLIGIIWRYVFRNPQSWTYEMSTISFVLVVIWAVPIAHRMNGHVVFDLFYNKASVKTQSYFRILSNLLILAFSILLLPYSIRFIASLRGMTMQIISWIPRAVIFIGFPIMYISAIMRSAIELIRDFFSLVKKKESTDNNGFLEKTSNEE